jgi:hypothetical protein
MPEAKTKPTKQSVDSFIKKIPDPASLRTLTYSPTTRPASHFVIKKNGSVKRYNEGRLKR